MPPVIIAVAIVAAEYAAGYIALTAALLQIAGTLAMAVLSRALAPKPPQPDNANSAQLNNSQLTSAVKQPVTPRRVIYGQVNASGPYAYIGATDSNSMLHLVIVVAGHEVASIDEVWLNNVVIPNDYIDGSGNVTNGPFKDFLRIKKHLGDPLQVADPDLVAEVSEWNSTGVLAGCAYIYLRLKYSQDVWAGGIPNCSVVMRGRLVYDPRTTDNRFSSNAALFARDYMTNEEYGFGLSDINISATNISAQANISDEIVDTDNLDTAVTAVDPASDIFTLTGDHVPIQMGDRIEIVTTGAAPAGLAVATDYYAIIYQFKDTPRIKIASTLLNAQAGIAIDVTDAGTGTHTIRRTGEPRYHGAGVIDTSATLQSNLLDILSAMSGRAVYAGGSWRLLCAAWVAPTVEINEGDMMGAMSVQTKLSMRDRYNQVQGSYISSLNDFQASDYPMVSSPVFIAQDNGLKIPSNLAMPFTNRALTAQRLAKVELLRSRQEIVLKTRLSLKGFQEQAGGNINVSSKRYRWVSKPFEVTNFSFGADGGSGDGTPPRPYVDVTLRETAEAIFNWTSGEGDEVDPAPNSNLPNPFNVLAVTGVAYSSRAIDTALGDTVYNLVLSWDLSPDAFVVEGGGYQIQYKLSADPDWRPYPPIPGDHNFADIVTSSPNVSYDLRIRAVNNLGVRSAWNTLLGAIVGHSGGITVTDDWDLFSNSVITTKDWGDFHTSPGATEDWGAYV